jgi:hypothetical protein
MDYVVLNSCYDTVYVGTDYSAAQKSLNSTPNSVMEVYSQDEYWGRIKVAHVPRT